MKERLAEMLRLVIQQVETDDEGDEQTIGQELWDVRSEARILLAEYDDLKKKK